MNSDVMHIRIPYNAYILTYSFCVLQLYDRKRPENVILASLWFVEAKPKMLCFMQPLINSLLNLEVNGVFVGISVIDSHRILVNSTTRHYCAVAK